MKVNYAFLFYLQVQYKELLCHPYVHDFQSRLIVCLFVSQYTTVIASSSQNTFYTTALGSDIGL